MSVGLIITLDQSIDLDLQPTGINEDNTLETAVLISLFSDQRAKDDDLIDSQSEKRGWWGDTYAEVDKDQIGSKLWLLAREKVTDETLSKAVTYAKEALQWMIDDGVASAVSVEASFVGQALFLRIGITRFNGVNQKFAVRWDQEGIRRL